MEKRGDEVHVNETEASGGSKEGVVRYVLVISLFLAIAALSLIWITGALTQDEAESRTSIDAPAGTSPEAAGDTTDSIVSEDAGEIEGAATADAPDTGAAATVEN
jgi:mRNA-degrading endonuclease toxin of MazEF toxin-antitoxin module